MILRHGRRKSFRHDENNHLLAKRCGWEWERKHNRKKFELTPSIQGTPHYRVLCRFMRKWEDFNFVIIRFVWCAITASSKILFSVIQHNKNLTLLTRICVMFEWCTLVVDEKMPVVLSELLRMSVSVETFSSCGRSDGEFGHLEGIRWCVARFPGNPPSSRRTSLRSNPQIPSIKVIFATSRKPPTTCKKLEQEIQVVQKCIILARICFLKRHCRMMPFILVNFQILVWSQKVYLCNCVHSEKLVDCHYFGLWWKIAHRNCCPWHQPGHRRSG